MDFFPQALWRRDRWNEHMDKHILFSGDMMCSSNCLMAHVEHPDFLVRPVVALRDPISWPKLM